MTVHVEEDMIDLCQYFGADSELLREYELRPQRVSLVGGALKVGTDRQTVFIKRPSCSAQRLGQIFAQVEQLAAGGLRVPRFMPTKYGDPFVVREEGNFYVLPKLVGGTPQLGRESVFMTAIDALARWHRLAKARPGELISLFRIDVARVFLHARTEIETFREQALLRTETTEFDGLFLEVREQLERQVMQAVAQLHWADYKRLCLQAYQTGELCHGRFVRSNLLYREQDMAILDHDHMHQGTQMLDLAAFLRRYAVRFSWDVRIVAKALAVYQEVRPLTALEVSVLYALLLFPEGVLRVLAWYYEERRGFPEDDFLDALEQELEWELARAGTLVELFGAPTTEAFGHSDFSLFLNQPDQAEAEEPAPNASATKGDEGRSSHVLARLWRKYRP